MSIQTAIENAQQKVKACYTQVASQGGTIPTTKNLANLPQAISTVSETYVPNYIPPKNNVDGVYKPDNTVTSFSVNGATFTDAYVLACAFKNCTNLTSVDLSSLIVIGGDYVMYSCFSGCTGLTRVDLSSVTNVTGSGAMNFCFQGCTNLTSVDLSSLTNASNISSCFQGCTNLTSVDLSSLTAISSGGGMSNCFQGCTNLTSVDLSSLTTISNSTVMNGCFQGCTNLTSVTIGGTTAINFGSYKNQFNNMFSGCNQASGIDLYIATDEATLSQFTGYPKFGATCEVRIHYTAQ